MPRLKQALKLCRIKRLGSLGSKTALAAATLLLYCVLRMERAQLPIAEHNLGPNLADIVPEKKECN